MAAFEQYPLHFSSDNGTSSTDELAFQLSSETTPATSIMEITNINTRNFAFAVQASSNNTLSYTVDPGYGIIAPGENAILVFSVNDTQQQAILANLECSDQFAVVSMVIPDDLAEFIESKPPLEGRTHILQRLSSQQLAKHAKYFSVRIDVAQAPPLQAAKKPRLAPITIGDDSSSSSEEEGDNNRSRINWEGIWDLPSVKAVEKLGVERLRELCGDQGLPLVTGNYAARGMATHLLAHMRSRPMPGAPPPPVIPRKKRVAQGAAEVVAKMSKVVVRPPNVTLPRALNAGGGLTSPEERLKIIFDGAKLCEDIRCKAIGLEGSDSDDEDPDTPRQIWDATRTAGPFLVSGAVGQLGKGNLSALNKVVESKIKNGEPLFSEPLPPYEGVLAAHAGVALRGALGGFTEGRRSGADVKALATAREKGRIVVWDASNYITVARHIKDLVARSRNLTIATTLKQDRYAAFCLQQVFLGSRRVADPGPDYFEVDFASRSEVEDKLRKMEVELAGDGRSHTLLDVGTIFERYHMIRRTDRSKGKCFPGSSVTKERLKHVSLCAIPFDVYAKDEASLLLDGLRYADGMKYEDFSDTTKPLRDYVVASLFGGSEPTEMVGVHQSSEARLERCMVAMLNVMFLFEDRNTRFKRKRTSHRLSLVHLGDKLPRHETDYSGTHHAYNWTLPYWPQGTADDPELPHTFMPEQA